MDPTDRKRLITVGPLTGLGVGWLTLFVVGSDLFVVSPLLPLIAADYGISPASAGLNVTVFSIAYMVAAPLLGHVADKIGRERLLSCCLLAFVAANLLTAAAANLAWLLIARLFAGAAAAGVSPSIYALVSNSAPSHRRATWLAVVVSGLLVALSFGAPIAGLAGASFGWPSVFASLAALSLFLIWANARVWPADGRTENIATPRHPLTMGAIVPRLALTAVWSTAVYAMYTYLGAGLAAAGYSTEHVAEVILFYGCGAICGVMIGGRMADWCGAGLTRGSAFAGLCLCCVLLRFALHTGVLVDWAFGLASGAAQLFFPAQQAALAKDFPAQRATILAWNNSALFLGISLGSLIGGQAILFGGFDANLVIAAAIAIGGWTINWVVTANPPRPRAGAFDRAV